MVADEIKKLAIEMEIQRAARGVMNAIEELRYRLDAIEREVSAGRSPNTSNTHVATELYNMLGRYDALRTAREIMEGQK